MNQEIPDMQTGFQRGRGTRDQIANIHGIMEKAKEFQKSIYFCFIYYTKNCVCITTNWKILKEMKIPAHLTCFLRNLYAGQKATVRTGCGTTDWFQIGKEYVKAVLPVLLFNFYAEYNMQNAGLDESQAGINIAGRNLKNLGYADDITLMAESDESLLRRVKEENEKAGLKLNIQRTKIMVSGPITSWQIEG